ncbi:hypothetical protein IJ541_05760 [bacterium]|nr:hypothetical protein [bacterium]
MNKIGWIICIFIFVFVTAFVISVDTSQNRRVKFTNQNFEINNEGNEIVNDSTTKINFGESKITNKSVKSHDKKISFEDNTQISNQNNSFSNQNNDYYAQDTNYSNTGKIQHKNLDDTELDIALNNAKNLQNQSYEPRPVRQIPPEYAYKNIDWSTWKSNFVNKILDDSMLIKELDNYADGSWFYYSFIVDDEGRISNIVVKSVFLSNEDKQKVANLIKSYQYKPITVFPQNSKRKTAKVTAVMMLSNESSHYSKPKDFNEIEQVKIKL